MPLFGSKNKHSHHADGVDRGNHTHDNRQDFAATGNTGTGITGNHPGARHGGAPAGVGAGAPGGAPGYGNQPNQAMNQPGGGAGAYNQQPGMGQGGAGYDSTGQTAMGQPNYVHTGNTNSDPYQDPNLAPAGHLNNNQQSGGGSRMTGKVEHAVGSLVGSQALKSKGMQKEQEAQAFKHQSAEIAEAERLEKEALLRRERAVQHGAHPSNKPLGGIQNQNGGGPY
ncbi:hypothetical protein EIP91_000042 [Steccherinum ochraceum]|uniref:Uncharacterized protein n=1 Tax=Steccherinum ochraceum TaxID=92696 RepID=A0A4R0RSI1_9APHY|nr:hypothetical protein EIP91_000042 [Steccherinum ochraceum]